MLNIQKIFEAQDKLDRKVVEVHGVTRSEFNWRRDTGVIYGVR
ncbi:hypothetical protein Bmyc01_50870 [Bacillus mycoides]|nr:hypothetical protein [Bacillus sp. NH11B]GLV66418.1 hypothetical protein Bmyc01_50870 [Bacillus mycoides]